MLLMLLKNTVVRKPDKVVWLHYYCDPAVDFFF